MSCDESVPQEKPLAIYEDSITQEERFREIKKNAPIQLASGFKVNLWASDSLAPDPVAISIDNSGSIYLISTNRRGISELDIRGHRNWMIESITLQTVEDRRKFLRRVLAPENSEKNTWFRDLNKDSVKDWRDLMVESDEIWKIQDVNGNGLADVSKRIFINKNEEITDVAGGILVKDNEVFLSAGPDMWKLKDTNKDEVLDERTSISHGYGVHVAFSAHGMSGVEQGPDGKIYWGIGDIGAHITSIDGEEYPYPNQGVLVRSNPDGSEFEVFASGLRNVHEFVFDNYGNIIGADNDGDHAGERERLVHLVEGSDSGWRINWQFGKYVDPLNNKYKVWMDEKLYLPRWEGQAAFILPPIRHTYVGPTGMLHNPGTALGSAWKNHFFLVEFIGNPSRSHIWAFDLNPSGATFEFNKETDILSGILPTGIDFGPDGALYLADWVNGWGTNNAGRVWKLDMEDLPSEEKAIRNETKKWINSDFTKVGDSELSSLLGYPDKRVRQKAQFALAKRGEKEILLRVVRENSNQMARIHGIWGIGQIAADDREVLEELKPFLKDADPEIIAQTLKTLGDRRYVELGNEYMELLNRPEPRIKFFAAQALGRTEYGDAVDALITMIEENNGRDLYLRHAAVLALSRIGNTEKITKLKESDKKELRIAAVLVLRRMGDEKVALFLDDPDEYVVTEAARAINDDWSIPNALPDLAGILDKARFTSEPLIRRAISAAVRVGEKQQLESLVNYSLRTDIDPELKREAMAALANWARPSVLDRVDGRYRGEVTRNPEEVIAAVKGNIDNYFQDPEYVLNVAEMLVRLNITDFNDRVFSAYENTKSGEVKSKLMIHLNDLNYEGMEGVIRKGLKSSYLELRSTSISLLEKLNVSPGELPEFIDPVLAKATLDEQQQMIGVLSRMPFSSTENTLDMLIQKAKGGDLHKGLLLDLFEVVDASGSEKLISGINEIRSGESVLEKYMGTLYGGNSNRGRNFFFRNSAGQCVRCHSINGNGGEVGPALDDIGSKLSRKQLLEALVVPDKRLAPGYGNTQLKLRNGQTVSGVIEGEDNVNITIKAAQGERVEIQKSEIIERKDMPSAMPSVSPFMSKREIRDMVEFLSE